MASLLLLNFAAGAWLQQSAFAAYDKPVRWVDSATMSMASIDRSQFAANGNLYYAGFDPSVFTGILSDSKERVSPEFRVPEGMREHVAFWLRIYTEFSSRQVVIHDDRHPEVIYEVLDFRELADRSRTRMAFEIVSERRIRSAMAEYRKAFDRLARSGKSRKPSRYESRILEALKSTRHKHRFSEFRANLRSQTGQRDHVMRGLLAADPFLPKMERIFTELGVPAEITRLSLVESSFNPRAVSRVGATGVWQFMHKSGLEYMMINPKLQIDERLSPLKSTVAAAKLLRRSMRMLKSWPLAITSYHNGYRGLRALAKDPRHLRNPFGFISLCGKARSPIGWASKNYYAGFLAMVHAEKYREIFFGTAPTAQSRPVAFRQAEGSRTGLQLAMERGVPLHLFKLYNPDIKNLNLRLPKGFWYAVPGTSDDLAELIQKHRAPGPRARI